jgi:hypothetical protein
MTEQMLGRMDEPTHLSEAKTQQLMVQHFRLSQRAQKLADIALENVR